MHKLSKKHRKVDKIDFRSFKILDFLSIIYAIFLSINLLINLYLKDTVNVYCSIILLVAFFVARVLLHVKKAFIATNIVTIGFYIVAFIQFFLIPESLTYYFIILIAPLLLAVIMVHNPTKYIYFVASIVVYFLFNILADKPLFDNYYFLAGFVPAFMVLMLFHKQLVSITSKNAQLIDELKESNEELMLFSQMMSHDLVGPIKTIKGFCKILSSKLPATDVENQNITNILMNSADKMFDLTKDLLHLSKLREEELVSEKIALPQVLSDVKNLLHFEIIDKNIEIIEELAEQNLFTSKEGLKNVLLNLVSNAIKYQPLNDPNHIPKIKISHRVVANQHEIVVADNGIGIDPKFYENLFQAFSKYHTQGDKYDGTGLGLNICKKIIEKLNGTISICTQAELGGTSFIIHLPL